MKTVLAYGDSLTWGSVPGTDARHPRADRWPVVLTEALDGRVEVIADGMRGRTTAYEEHLADTDRNGARLLASALYTHAPVDLVILMLGTNDLKPHVCGSATGALQGMRRLVEIAQNHAARDGSQPVDVLVVAPPPLCETADPFYAAIFAGGLKQSAMLASLYADLADEADCGFFDAGSVAQASPVDGIHLDAPNTRAVGKALAPMAHVMLGL